MQAEYIHPKALPCLLMAAVVVVNGVMALAGV
jgi:hypothetical protein